MVIETITEALKKCGATNIQVTIEVKKEPRPAAIANFFLRMIERSPSPSATLGKMCFFGLTALVMFIFSIEYAIEKGDLSVFFVFFVALVLGFSILFLNELNRMQ